jgi:biotin transport system substrate-specific component
MGAHHLIPMLGKPKMSTISGVKLQTLFDTAAGSRSRALALHVVCIVIASLVITLSAKVSIPFYPVPLTLQTLAVLLIGLGLGPRLGPVSVTLYLFQGAMGLPVFAGAPANGVGLSYMAGPTGGRSSTTALAAMLVGTVLIYLPGLIWLGYVVGWDKPVLQFGLYPFIYGDLLKLCLGALCVPLAWKALDPTSR